MGLNRLFIISALLIAHPWGWAFLPCPWQRPANSPESVLLKDVQCERCIRKWLENPRQSHFLNLEGSCCRNMFGLQKNKSVSFS